MSWVVPPLLIAVFAAAVPVAVCAVGVPLALGVVKVNSNVVNCAGER
jgi:hypothetical protein